MTKEVGGNENVQYTVPAATSKEPPQNGWCETDTAPAMRIGDTPLYARRSSTVPGVSYLPIYRTEYENNKHKISE